MRRVATCLAGGFEEIRGAAMVAHAIEPHGARSLIVVVIACHGLTGQSYPDASHTAAEADAVICWPKLDPLALHTVAALWMPCVGRCFVARVRRGRVDLGELSMNGVNDK